MKSTTKEMIIMLVLAILATPMAALAYHWFRHHDNKTVNQAENKND